uniref:S-acyltransferase n=1 Tax=Rhizophora mucronata TaxID=61149 RepID=A0A2P2N6D2_RHIMU
MQPPTRRSCNNIGGIFCGLFVHEDCRKRDGASEQQGAAEEALFCTLCNAEVCITSAAKSIHIFSLGLTYYTSRDIFLNNCTFPWPP